MLLDLFKSAGDPVFLILWMAMRFELIIKFQKLQCALEPTVSLSQMFIFLETENSVIKKQLKLFETNTVKFVYEDSSLSSQYYQQLCFIHAPRCNKGYFILIW